MTYRPDQHPSIPTSWCLRNDEGHILDLELEDGTREPHRFDSAADARQFMLTKAFHDQIKREQEK